jgi:putative IMPACT (imprinted ancient) family translation regulator
LYRAYSQCAEDTILKAGLEVIVPQKNISLNYPYHFSRKIENILNKYSGRIISSDFKTEVNTEILVPQKLSDKFIEEVLNVGGDKIKVMVES